MHGSSLEPEKVTARLAGALQEVFDLAPRSDPSWLLTNI